MKNILSRIFLLIFVKQLLLLIYLRPEFIKIDRSLIQWIDTEISQQQLLAMLLNYAFQSNTKVIAEGIERIEEYHYIREAGVHYAQGYAIGRPNEQLLEAKEPHLESQVDKICWSGKLLKKQNGLVSILSTAVTREKS